MAGVTVRRQRGNLPAGVTSFVGRRRDTAEVVRLLSSSRLVTLTGIGGVGKTRLALHVAEGRRRAFTDGAWWVELADLSDPDLLAVTVMQAIGMEQQATGTAAELIEYLKDQQLLLVLDNCEHLVASCAALMDDLLPSAPWVRVLATSREPLGAMGEHTFDVPPLSVPSEESLASGLGDPAQCEAITLFEERAAAAAPGFAVTEANQDAVVALCRRLDGLPLAIELAAGRTRALAVDQILLRLDDRYRLMTSAGRRGLPRHQTLRAAMDWSYRLCAEPERILWARLSVFNGGFDLRAAEVICSGAGLAREAVLEALIGLVDKSLVVCEEQGRRYRLLETVRWYARERLLERHEERDVCHRHLDYYLELAEEWGTEWYSSNQARVFVTIQNERANLRAALTFCLTEKGLEQTGLRLAGSLWMFWLFGPIPEGQYWLDRMLAHDTEPSQARAQALYAAGGLAVYQGDAQPGLALLDQSRDLALEVGDQEDFAHATYLSGLADIRRGDTTRGISRLEEGLELERALGERNPSVILAQSALGYAQLAIGEAEQAVTTLKSCLADSEAVGERLLRSVVLYCLGLAEWRCGNTTKAAEREREALRIRRDFNDQIGVARAIEVLAWIAAEQGDAVRAARLLGASRRLWQPRPHLAGTTFQAGSHAACERKAYEALGGRTFEIEFQYGSELDADEAIDYALGATLEARHSKQPGPAPPALTRREAEVAELVAEGMTNKGIAEKLVISQRTAENHIEHVLTKLGFTSRAQIAAWVAAHKTPSS